MRLLTVKQLSAMVLGAALMFLGGTGSLNATGSSAAQFLKIGAGARAAAMGNAFTSVADDVTAGYWNPAGLSQITAPEISVMHNQGLVGTKYEYLGGAMPLKNSAVGFSFSSLNYGSIDRYDNSDVKNGRFDAGSSVGNLTFSSRIGDSFHWGVTAKYLNESIDGIKASAMAGDVGLLTRVKGIAIGATLQNMGQKIKFVKEEESLPQLLRVGASRKFMNEKLLLALGGSKYNDANSTVQAGLEYAVVKTLVLRAGVDSSTGLTAGMGINISNFSIDYAVMPFGDLGNTHRLSLRVKFSPAK